MIPEAARPAIRALVNPFAGTNIGRTGSCTVPVPTSGTTAKHRSMDECTGITPGPCPNKRRAEQASGANPEGMRKNARDDVRCFADC
jgi:hypothetical protein